MSKSLNNVPLTLVDRDALYQVLSALQGPPHLIREIQATQNFAGNPLQLLIDSYNKGLKMKFVGIHEDDIARMPEQGEKHE